MDSFGLSSLPQYSGPTTTAKSAAEGRLKVDAGRRKRKILRKTVKKYSKKGRKDHSLK